ncbi:hypoxanthine phosphoribosyltransferase [Neolewinella litorea]|uniref:Hypoxanthine phosphoribosyltransferase n=1 Tax=Neolewinella litorea TaxID=2562452 RepID=A0A4S4NL51_9BACT|nr:hypoxanthine phosphoribosyltransferase [Neolewinella litorea]THH40624.1 hypoxanthine phosphoribosyltransferase [Neolewinella litorea]
MSAPLTDRIRLHEHYFRPFLSREQLEVRVKELGMALHDQLAGANPCFVVMLKGAFVFAADLVRASRLEGEVCFVRTSSYSGTNTVGEVKLLIPPEAELVRGKDIVLIEDIIDSGYTMKAFLPILQQLEPRSITLVTLLHKPDAQRVEVPIDLIGFTIPTKFVVGYGLDYDGLGRNLPAIYQLDESY